MVFCSVCEARLRKEPDGECDAKMESCKNICSQLPIDAWKDGLDLCTSCFLWLIANYNDIKAGRQHDRAAVKYLRLMVIDQEPLVALRRFCAGSRLN